MVMGTYKKKRWVFWLTFLSVCLLILTFTMMQNNRELRNHINNYFYPVTPGIISCEQSDEWQTVSFSLLDGASNECLKDSFSYTTPFVHKLLVCSATSSDKSTIEIRVLDSNGNIVIDNIMLKNDSSISLETLDGNTDYTLQYRYGNGKYYFYIC